MTDRHRERWRNVPGWPGYRISSNGRARGPRGLLRPWQDKDGYLCVTLSAAGRRRHVPVHILVLEVFAGPRPDGQEGCHGNGDHQDNVLVNLRWDTHRENERDKKRESWKESETVSGPRDSLLPVTGGLGR